MEDEAIVNMFWNRDESAVAEAEKRYGGYCLHIAGNVLRDSHDAEECLNDALLAAWESIPPNRPANLKAYLGILVRNAALDRSRRSAAQKRRPEALESIEELGDLADAFDVERIADANELSRLITAYLRTLGAAERRVFIRRYWYYESIAEISERYGFTQGKVKMMLKRTRDSLADFLKKEDNYEY
ncbi:MAG: sigma-70 family RNA polymerase sigma factor [Clostridia bacterium]|nr:sigma-70 family RNA polymerase sigma factor [Clostridia bacterium]